VVSPGHRRRRPGTTATSRTPPRGRRDSGCGSWSTSWSGWRLPGNRSSFTQGGRARTLNGNGPALYLAPGDER
jgi:hypothetical protein